MYGGVNAAFQHGITAPFRRRRRDPPPPALDRRPPQPRRIEGRRDSAGDDPSSRDGQRHRDHEDRSNGDRVRRRRGVGGRDPAARTPVETLRNADERDGERYRAGTEDASASESENTPERRGGAATQLTGSDSVPLKSKAADGKKSPAGEDESGGDAAERTPRDNRGGPLEAPKHAARTLTGRELQVRTFTGAAHDSSPEWN